MRLLGTLSDRRLTQEFSYYLTRKGIENLFEPDPHAPVNEDSYLIWIVDEEDVETATAYFDEFQKNPHDPKFHGHYREVKKIEEAKRQQERRIEQADEEVAKPPFAPRRRRYGWLTIALVVFAAVCYFWGGFIATADKQTNDVAIVITQPPYPQFLYDFPTTFQLYNQLAKEYPLHEIEDLSELPPAGRQLLDEAENTPYWRGIYFEFLAWLHPPEGKNKGIGPLFEKIRQGEVWRLFTPAVLHADIFHLLFNVIWILVLGTQMEHRLGWLRYCLFILITGIVANTAQYLISGPLFLGLSGIVCAMLGFIWIRQRKAPWEGYQLHRVTVIFIVIFVGAMLLLQLISFGFEVTGNPPIGPPIANTAHFAGFAIGILFGYLHLFADHRALPR